MNYLSNNSWIFYGDIHFYNTNSLDLCFVVRIFFQFDLQLNLKFKIKRLKIGKRYLILIKKGIYAYSK